MQCRALVLLLVHIVLVSSVSHNHNQWQHANTAAKVTKYTAVGTFGLLDGTGEKQHYPQFRTAEDDNRCIIVLQG
jgi:hypothetical protein